MCLCGGVSGTFFAIAPAAFDKTAFLWYTCIENGVVCPQACTRRAPHARISLKVSEEMVKIESVEPGSRAEKAGVLPGDILLSINDNEITDVLDYRFYLANNIVKLTLHRGPELLSLTIHKFQYDDIGLSFETPLMDRKHSCANKCVFCFIDQNPKGLRESLYFKDDDSRLSFLHGNYVTLTNLHECDIDRIIKMHLSPVNVSVHTTNPDLRVKMMVNRRAGKVLSYLKRMADAGISLCGQVVLCRGLNDGEELTRTMHDLAGLFPAMSSVSIVPAGLTKFRDGLYPLTLFNAEECAAVIRQVNEFGEECLKRHGTRIFYCSDEFYIKAGLPLPGEEYYESYSQIENGVGMLTSLNADFDFELSDPDFEGTYPIKFSHRKVSVVTGVAASDTIKALMARLEARVSGLTIEVHTIINHFFGETITVAGLLTGKDMSQQLAGSDLGDLLLIPSNTLRSEGDLFLCGMTPQELSDKLGVPLATTGHTAADQISTILGLNEPMWVPKQGESLGK